MQSGPHSGSLQEGTWKHWPCRKPTQRQAWPAGIRHGSTPRSSRVTRAGWLTSSWRQPASPERLSLGSGGVALLAPTSATPELRPAFEPCPKISRKRKTQLERNRSAVGKSQLLGEPASALLCSCFVSAVACPDRPSCPRDQSTIKANPVPPPPGFVQEPVPERPQRLAVKPLCAPALRVQASSLSLPNARPVLVKWDLVQAHVGATKWVALPHFARGVSGCLNSAFLGLF